MCHWPIGWNNFIIFHFDWKLCLNMVGYVWVIYLTRLWLISCRATACAAFNTENYSHWWLFESQEVWHSYLVGLLLLTAAFVFTESNSNLETEVWTWKSRIHNYRWCKWWLPQPLQPPNVCLFKTCINPYSRHMAWYMYIVMGYGLWWYIVNPINLHC